MEQHNDSSDGAMTDAERASTDANRFGAGFELGNYDAAYTSDVYRLATVDDSCSQPFKDGHLLGYHSSHELHEIEHAGTRTRVKALRAQYVIELGATHAHHSRD